MNVDTGELKRFAAFKLEEEHNAAQEGFTQVPKQYEEEANEILGDEDRAFADMNSDTPLVKWAKSQRKPKNKNKAKMIKQSRRRNRK